MGLDTMLPVSAEGLRGLMPPCDAVVVVEEAIERDFDSSAELDRTFLDVDAGQFALMPRRDAPLVGVKVASDTSANSACGLNRLRLLRASASGDRGYRDFIARIRGCRYGCCRGVLDVYDIITTRNVVIGSTILDPNRPALFKQWIVSGRLRRG